MPHIEIDGRKLEVREGSMVIEAADAAGIYIPRFCYHKKLSVAANCRMCLVDVEKAAKPLPACATPVTEGMVVHTRSAKAVDAQKGVMEFLLINHPLDCPICDQGGECDLQDLAVGYGKDASRFAEKKRIVLDKYIGPLIATDMTRCIHCTRCVRFGQEIAGIMELGATGRGENMRIGLYVEGTVDSEMSGNMIDLCPVGALTSRPFRFNARAWELQDFHSVAPHDCVGSNITVQVLRNEVRRVLPRDNEAINECWLSDRDRFSYASLESKDRVLKPMIREGGTLRETDWQTALNFAASGLRRIVETHGCEQLGALAAPTATVEELYLLQKLTRGLGSNNIDHRLRARDFRDDAGAPLFPSLGMPIAELENLDAVLLIGSDLRRDQPILAHRLRKAWTKGRTAIMAVNPADYDFRFTLAHKSVAPVPAMARSLACVAAALAQMSGSTLPAEAAAWCAGSSPGDAERAIAERLRAASKKHVLLGSGAMRHADASVLRALAQTIAELSGATVGHLCDANGAGAWLAGCVPHRAAAGRRCDRPGMNAAQMLATPRKGLVLLGAEPEGDFADAAQAMRALDAADFVVSISTFRSAATEKAHVVLPLAAFTETDGAFVNCEGVAQSFAAAVRPPGDARPGWKILRVLGNVLGLAGFEFTTAAEVRAEALPAAVSMPARIYEGAMPAPNGASAVAGALDVPIYAVDAYTRRARPLQMTKEAKGGAPA
jgi:NADH-quinone oxidoreductase subunit G